MGAHGYPFEIDMWIVSRIGFFSVVQKPSDRAQSTLTVRARVAGDLDTLRAQYLPELGPTEATPNNDYAFRATAPQDKVAEAVKALVADIDYSNFKIEVAKVQGADRSHKYHDVWSALYRLQKR